MELFHHAHEKHANKRTSTFAPATFASRKVSACLVLLTFVYISTLGLGIKHIDDKQAPCLNEDSGSEEVGLLSRIVNPLPARHNTDIHLCICFFGLLRQLNFTVTSIEENLFGVLSSNDIRFTTYMHTFRLRGPLHNPRSLDFNTTVDVDFARLAPKMVIIEDQDEFDKGANFEQYTHHGDPYDDDFRSHRNQIREGRSLEQVTRLWLHDDSNCSHVMYYRPDMLLASPFDVSELLQVRHMSWFTGAYHEYGGLNDRFAFGDPEGMKIWGTRIRHARRYSEKFLLKAEPFVKYVAGLANIRLQHTKLCSLRYRPIGVHPADVDICN